MADNYTQSSCPDFSAGEIYKKHSGLIRRIIRCHVKNEYQADDIFQDFFLQLVANPITADVEDIERYLYRSVMNCIINSIRRTAVYHSHVDKYSGNAGSFKASEYKPQNCFIEPEELSKTFSLIRDQLPRNQAQAVSLRCIDNRQIPEIAEIMGVNTNSASRYVSMGLKRIYQYITAVEGGA